MYKWKKGVSKCTRTLKGNEERICCDDIFTKNHNTEQVILQNLRYNGYLKEEKIPPKTV